MNESNTINDSTLIINLNEEYKIKIEEAKDFDTSIFKDVYDRALKNVEEIVNQSSKNDVYDDFNNIIAFTGERGKGKSSSMISFRNVLVSSVENRKNWKKFVNSPTYTIKFARINIVDPSLFRRGESLFEIILAQMFQKFQEHIKHKDCQLTDDDRRNIIKHFQEVFENLQIINSDRKDLYKKDSIEVLSRLATSSNLRECFRKLVITYLEKFEKFEKNEGFLVIAIDDFDLNISSTYEMLEDIRQFLMQSNIILLIACKMEQLKETITLYYKTEKLENEIENKANRYLDKLFPFTRTIELPSFTINSQFRKIDTIIINNYGVESKYSLNNGGSIKNLYDFLIFNIESKLNIFVSKYEFRQNQIIPDTLREIISLIENVKDENLDDFNRFLLSKSNSILNNNNNIDYNISNSDNISQFLIFYQILTDFLDKDFENKKLVVLNPKHLLVADFITVFEYLESNIRITDTNKLKFIDFIKILITLFVTNNKLNYSNLFIHNGIIQNLPAESNKYRRDWVKFNFELKEVNNYSNQESIFLIVALIQSYSDPDFKFRESKNNYFSKIFGNYTQGIMCPYSIFANYFYISKYVIKHQSNYPNLAREIISYQKKYFEKKISFLTLLKDPSFSKEFIDGISNYAFNYRNKTPHYFLLIYEYLFEGGLKSLKSISSNHEYIVNDEVIESYTDFPLFKLWQDELESEKSIIADLVNNIYESSKSDYSKIKINVQLNNLFKTYLSRNLEGSRTLSNFQNEIKKLSPNHDSIKIIDEFKEYLKKYNELNDFDKKEKITEKDKKLNDLKNYLQNILNG